MPRRDRVPRAAAVDAASGVDQDAGIEDPGRVELGLGGAQGGGEGGRALAVVPGAVVAADRVVVGDRAAALDQRLGDGRLDLVPLLDLAAAHRRREHREVGRGAVGIDVGEAAADARRARPLGAARRRPRRPRARVVSITVAWNSSKRSQVIAVSKVSESTPQATKVSRR